MDGYIVPVYRGIKEIEYLLKLLYEDNDFSNKAWIAGSYANYCLDPDFLNKEKVHLPNDVDIFCSNSEVLNELVILFTRHFGQARNESSLSYRFWNPGRIEINLIKIIYGSTIEEILDEFDMQHSKVVLLSKDFGLIYGEWPFDQTIRLSKNISNTTFTLLRIIKYTRDGYKLDYGTVEHLFNAIRKCDDAKFADGINLSKRIGENQEWFEDYPNGID